MLGKNNISLMCRLFYIFFWIRHWLPMILIPIMQQTAARRSTGFGHIAYRSVSMKFAYVRIVKRNLVVIGNHLRSTWRRATTTEKSLRPWVSVCPWEASQWPAEECLY
jgi:hypothetical protein